MKQRCKYREKKNLFDLNLLFYYQINQINIYLNYIIFYLNNLNGNQIDNFSVLGTPRENRIF